MFFSIAQYFYFSRYVPAKILYQCSKETTIVITSSLLIASVKRSKQKKGKKLQTKNENVSNASIN